MSRIINKLKQVRWYIWLRDIALWCAVFFVISVWQSRNMLDIDSNIVIEKKLLVGLDGQMSTLLKPDKPTLIYFFAPWCQACALSIGNLEYLNLDKINIVRVALDYSNVEQVQRFAEQHNISSQILLGHESLKQQFKIRGYPTYYIVDEQFMNKQHKVLAKSYGYSTALGLKLRQIFSG